MMTLENTSGYTQQQLDALNSEFAARFMAGDWGNAERAEAEGWFGDEVAGR